MKLKFSFIALSTVLAALGQTPATGRLLPVVTLPPGVADFRTALAGAFDKAGHERRTLEGTVTYAGGSAVPFKFTREQDQNVRLDVGAAGSVSTLIVTSAAQSPKAAQTTAGASDQINHNILETLASDAPEGVLYLYGSASGVISMGGPYQPPGTNASYQGPFWNIAASHEKSAYQTGAPDRVKRFLFDSSTKLLISVLYQSAAGTVEVDYAGWSTSGGTACPATITRTEAGNVVLTITVSSCDSSATVNDNLFSL